MLLAIPIAIAFLLLAAGALLGAFARSGTQETLGGVMIMVGMLVLAFSGIIWKLAQ